MHRALTLLGVLGALLWVSPSWAAEGDRDGQPCDTGTTWAGGWCRLICDDYDSNETCTEFAMADTRRDVCAISLRNSGTGPCTAATVTITESFVAGGEDATDLTTLVFGGVERTYIDSSAAGPAMHLQTVITNLVGCTALDVVMDCK